MSKTGSAAQNTHLFFVIRYDIIVLLVKIFRQTFLLLSIYWRIMVSEKANVR